jgi:TolA-binding protein
MTLRAAQIRTAFVLAALTALTGTLSAGEKRTAPANAAQRPKASVEKNAPKFTPEERATLRQQIKERLSKQVSELQKKKANGAINDEERQRLQRLEVLANRFRNQGSNPPGTGSAKAPLNNSATAKPKTK